MANYSNLKAAIADVIKTNGTKAITGQVLQDVLNSMVSVIGANYQFAGVATPSTNPGTPDQNVFYIAMQGGTYTNFNATALPDGISLLMWNGSWSSQVISYNNGGVFDISVYKSTGGTLATFADLAAALGTNGANVPVAARKGGMTICFVQSSDNMYVRCNLLAQSFTTDITQWAVDDVGVYVDNPEFIEANTDSNGKLLEARKVDGTKVEYCDVEFCGDVKVNNISLPDKIKSLEKNKNKYLYRLSDDISFDSIIANGWTKETSNHTLTNSNDASYGNNLIINKQYAIDTRYFAFDFIVNSSNTKVYAGTKDSKTADSRNLVSVDFQNKTISCYPFSGTIPTVPYRTSSISIESDSYIGRKYRLVISRKDRKLKAVLIDLLDNTTKGVLETDVWVNSRMFFWDFPCICSVNGSMTLCEVVINCDKNTSLTTQLYITGDSITEGERLVDDSERWTTLLANNFGENSVIVSGRSSGQYNDVYDRIISEAYILKPVYVMVTIGTNGGNTKRNIKKVIDAILSIPSIPIINHIPCNTYNGHILANQIIDEAISEYPLNNVRCCKFDVATAIDYNIENGCDTSLFYADGSHPNAAGCLRMYNRIKIDCPELFDSIL